MATVRWAHLCDHAFFDNGGKPCIIGVFHKIATTVVPTRAMRAALIFEVDGSPGERPALHVRLMAPDSPDPLIDVPTRPISLSPGGGATNVMGLDNLVLPDYGPYEMRIELDGQPAATVTFSVERPPAPAQP